MDILRDILLVLHIIGFAGVFGGVLSQIAAAKRGEAKINGAILHSALLLLVTGLGLVGMFYMNDAGDLVNNMKIGVKSLILIVILALAIVGKVKKRTNGGMLALIGLLAVTNVVLAVVW